MRAYSVVTKLLDKLKEHGGLTEELQEKVDVLYLTGRINNDEYLELCDKQGYRLNRIDDHTVELVKDDEYEIPYGDYTNPIQIPSDGIEVEFGKWYYVEDKELPHEAKADAFVTAEDFNDPRWFDFVRIV